MLESCRRMTAPSSWPTRCGRRRSSAPTAPKGRQLSLEAIAHFAESPGAQGYSQACQVFGIDPAVGIGDPFLAYQFRVALLAVGSPESAEDNDPGQSHRDRLAASREALDLAP